MSDKKELTIKNYNLTPDTHIVSQTEKATLLKISDTKGVWVGNNFITLNAKGNLSVGVAKEFEYTAVVLADKDNKRDEKVKGSDLIPALNWAVAGGRPEVSVDIYRKSAAAKASE